MAGATSSSKRDLRRFSKVYPYVRVRKQIARVLEDAPVDLDIEKGMLGFTNSDQANYNFTGTYATVPAVVVTSVDSAGNDQANVNAVISAITTTNMTVKTSQTFTGQVHFQVIKVTPPE